MTGIDTPISLIRDDLASKLWLSVANRIYYAKAYKNEKTINGSLELIPEIYSKEKEYNELLFDDQYNVLVFFDVSDERTEIFEEAKATISAVFSVNLSAIYPAETWRQEEEAHRDVLKIILESRNSYRISEANLTTGIESYGSYYKGNLKQFNMQPWHTFRVDMTAHFNYDCHKNISGLGYAYPDPIIF